MPIQATRDVVEFSVVSGDGARNLGQQLVDRRDIDAVAAAHRIRATLLISDRDRPFAEQYGRPHKSPGACALVAGKAARLAGPDDRGGAERPRDGIEAALHGLAGVEAVR